MADIASVMNSAVGIIAIILSIIAAGAVVGLVTWKLLERKKYGQYICRILEKDGLGNVITYTDKAGIFVDSKTKNKRLFLKGANVGLMVDNIPYMMENGKKIIYLLRDGFKNFHFIKMDVHNPTVDLSVTEEDINWAINSYERAKQLFSSSLLMQLMPYILLAFVTIVILVIFIYFFKDFAVLKDVATELKLAATQIAQARTGTVVIQ